MSPPETARVSDDAAAIAREVLEDGHSAECDWFLGACDCGWMQRQNVMRIKGLATAYLAAAPAPSAPATAGAEPNQRAVVAKAADESSGRAGGSGGTAMGDPNAGATPAHGSTQQPPPAPQVAAEGPTAEWIAAAEVCMAFTRAMSACPGDWKKSHEGRAGQAAEAALRALPAAAPPTRGERERADLEKALGWLANGACPPQMVVDALDAYLDSRSQP